jgi:hypothetical protein
MIYKSMFSALVDVCKIEFALKDQRAQHSTGSNFFFLVLEYPNQESKRKCVKEKKKERLAAICLEENMSFYLCFFYSPLRNNIYCDNEI